MQILIYIFYAFAALGALIWAAARVAFYILGPRSAQRLSFLQYVYTRGGAGGTFIAFTDRVIKILAFSALIAYLCRQF